MERTMKVVLAPDSFKGSLSSIEVIKTIKAGMESVFPGIEIIEVPIADGGEGTIEALIYGNKGVTIPKIIKDPLNRPVDSHYGVIGQKALIEMAKCSGLTMLEEKERNPLMTSSQGTGQMIKQALDDGFRDIVIGLGGSGTNDGGTGAMQALGVKFLNKHMEEIPYMCGRSLKDIERIDISNLDQRIRQCNIQIMCDVTNPLTGLLGATYVYGKQKGGDKESLQALEAGMLNYEGKLKATFGKEIGLIPGSGAAGGMGAAMVAFLQAQLVSGIETVLELVDFETKIDQADFIVTGEGRVDFQSAKGKVIHGITEVGNRKNIPVIVIAGGVGEGVEDVYDLGVKAIFTLPNKPMKLEDAMINTEELLQDLTYNMCQVIHLGQLMA